MPYALVGDSCPPSLPFVFNLPPSESEAMREKGIDIAPPLLKELSFQGKPARETNAIHTCCDVGETESSLQLLEEEICTQANTTVQGSDAATVLHEVERPSLAPNTAEQREGAKLHIFTTPFQKVTDPTTCNNNNKKNVEMSTFTSTNIELADTQLDVQPSCNENGNRSTSYPRNNSSGSNSFDSLPSLSLFYIDGVSCGTQTLAEQIYLHKGTKKRKAPPETKSISEPQMDEAAGKRDEAKVTLYFMSDDGECNRTEEELDEETFDIGEVRLFPMRKMWRVCLLVDHGIVVVMP